MQQFEVRCPSCNVTFPVETKRCLHCGGRLARGHRSALDDQIATELSESGPQEFGREPSRRDPEPATSAAPFAEAEDEPPEPRSLLRAGMSVIWLMIIALGLLARICSGGG